jgi:transposase
VPAPEAAAVFGGLRCPARATARVAEPTWVAPYPTRLRVPRGSTCRRAIDAQIAPLEREPRQLARRQTGCRALMGLYGMGELTSLVTLCELGDVGRLSASRKAVRMAGIDIGVHRSDRRSRVGKLNRQGSPHLRWALYEAALAACRPSSPDHADYLALKARGLSHTRASLTIARKLARRSFHVLRELGPNALEPVPTR